MGTTSGTDTVTSDATQTEIGLVAVELLASRLCHDLIGPVGAIGNGLELLAEESSRFAGETVTLVTRSAERTAAPRTADGSSPFAQLRIVALTARAGRAILAAALGKAPDGEQTLLKDLAERQPGVFAHRVTCFDRNFPGYDLITAILLAKGHVIARVREGIALPFQDTPDRGWLPDGSRMSWLNAPSGKKEDRLPVRVSEHSALVPGPERC